MSPEPAHCQHTAPNPYFEFYKKIKTLGCAVGWEGTGFGLNEAYVRTGALHKDSDPAPSLTEKAMCLNHCFHIQTEYGTPSVGIT